MNDNEVLEWLADPHWLCLDCDVHTGVIGEYYMVNGDVWMMFGVERGMLCISCLEARMGRMLTPSDFSDVPLNRSDSWFRSELLTSRLGI